MSGKQLIRLSNANVQVDREATRKLKTVNLSKFCDSIYDLTLYAIPGREFSPTAKDCAL